MGFESMKKLQSIIIGRLADNIRNEFICTKYRVKLAKKPNVLYSNIPNYSKIKHLVILTGLLFSNSCAQYKGNLSIAGNWYACARNGDYIEMLIKGNKYRYFSNFGVITEWEEYQISGDTLIQFNKNLIEDSIIKNKTIITHIDQNQFELNYLTSRETWEMHRINEEIDFKKSDKEILEGTLQRFARIGCQDLRSENEKQKDSLDRIIDFQF